MSIGGRKYHHRPTSGPARDHRTADPVSGRRRSTRPKGENAFQAAPLAWIAARRSPPGLSGPPLEARQLLGVADGVEADDAAVLDAYRQDAADLVAARRSKAGWPLTCVGRSAMRPTPGPRAIRPRTLAASSGPTTGSSAAGTTPPPSVSRTTSGLLKDVLGHVAEHLVGNGERQVAIGDERLGGGVRTPGARSLPGHALVHRRLPPVASCPSHAVAPARPAISPPSPAGHHRSRWADPRSFDAGRPCGPPRTRRAGPSPMGAPGRQPA